MPVVNIAAILGKFSQGYELNLVKSVRYYPQNLDKGGDNFQNNKLYLARL